MQLKLHIDANKNNFLTAMLIIRLIFFYSFHGYVVHSGTHQNQRFPRHAELVSVS